MIRAQIINHGEKRDLDLMNLNYDISQTMLCREFI